MSGDPTPKTKRVILIRNAQSYDFGGAERFPVDLALQLQQHGREPIVVSRNKQLLFYARNNNVWRRRGAWWSRQNWSGKNALLFPIYLGWLLLLFGWYIRLFLELRPKLVHPQSKDDFVAATLAARLLRIPVIWTDHADLKYIYANHAIWYKNPVGKLVYACSHLARHITLVSHSEAQHITDSLGQSLGPRYTVVHNGVLDRRGELEHTNNKDFTYCSTSRLVTTKGIGELITAFQALHATHPDTRLLIVGDGPEQETFTAQAAGDAAITFVGHSDTPLEQLAASDIFVHPSYHEGFSLSIVEAAMLGKPIIACEVGGNVEIVEDEVTGLLVPARSADALQAAMERLYSDRALMTKLGDSARKRYEASFNLETIVTERFIPLYED